MTPDRRENLKLALELAKLVLQVVGLAAIAFAYLSYRDSVSKADQDTYRFISSDWNDHLRLFIEHPELRPYFFEGANIPVGRDKALVESVADVRLDKMDAILTYFSQRGASDTTIDGWIVTFEDAFKRSPALCSAIQGVERDYGLIVPVAERSCTRRPSNGR